MNDIAPPLYGTAHAHGANRNDPSELGNAYPRSQASFATSSSAGDEIHTSFHPVQAATAIGEESTRIRTLIPAELTPHKVNAYAAQLTKYCDDVLHMLPESIEGHDPVRFADEYLHFYRRLSSGRANLQAITSDPQHAFLAHLTVQHECAAYDILMNAAARQLLEVRGHLQTLADHSQAQTAGHKRVISELNTVFDADFARRFPIAGPGVALLPEIARAAVSRAGKADANPLGTPVGAGGMRSGGDTVPNESTKASPSPWMVPTLGVSALVTVVALTAFLILRARRARQRKQLAQQQQMQQQQTQQQQMQPQGRPQQFMPPAPPAFTPYTYPVGAQGGADGIPPVTLAPNGIMQNPNMPVIPPLMPGGINMGGGIPQNGVAPQPGINPYSMPAFPNPAWLGYSNGAGYDPLYYATW